jgi:hypothetical protein
VIFRERKKSFCTKVARVSEVSEVHLLVDLGVESQLFWTRLDSHGVHSRIVRGQLDIKHHKKLFYFPPRWIGVV